MIYVYGTELNRPVTYAPISKDDAQALAEFGQK